MLQLKSHSQSRCPNLIIICLGTRFKKPIIHGALTSSLFSGLLGQSLPGRGSIYLSQSTKFKAPAYVNTPLTASVEIVQLRADKGIVILKTECVNADTQALLITGEAVVMVDKACIERSPVAKL